MQEIKTIMINKYQSVSISIYKYLLVLWVLLFVAFIPFTALAVLDDPRVYFEPTKPIYHSTDEEIRIDVLLDSPQPINAFSLEIGFDVQKMAFLSVQDKGSIANVWQGFPPESGGGIIKLEGGMTEPFQGERGQVAQLIFLPVAEGKVQISFRRAMLYLADGRGTAVLPQKELEKIEISSSAPPPKELVYDSTPPKVSEIIFATNPEDKARILYFKVSDERTGVKEVSIRWRNWIFWGPRWPATSPLKVPSDAWAGQLRVTDGAGNVEIRTIVIWQEAIKKGLLILLAIFVLWRVFIAKPRENFA